MNEMRLYDQNWKEVEKWHSLNDYDNDQLPQFKVHAFTSGMTYMRKNNLESGYIVIVTDSEILAKQVSLNSNKYKKLAGWEKVK